MDEDTAHRLWTTYEPYHAVVYFAPEARAAASAVGLRGGWMAYFAGRAAPLGPVGPEIVTATFFGFHPDMVARAIPDAWRYAAPADVLATRIEAVGAALRRLLGDGLAAPALAEAAELARGVALRQSAAGRPLFAAWAAQPPPAEPHLALWMATTLLREARGDGHVAALTAAGVDGLEAHVLQVARGAVPREVIEPYRGWSADDWTAATERLRARGWLDEHGALTAAGNAVRDGIEATTDRLAAQPWTEGEAERFLELLAPVLARLLGAGGIPVPNPIGVPGIATG